MRRFTSLPQADRLTSHRFFTQYGSGRALKARLKADQALGLAMSKGLHRLSAQSTGVSSTAQSSFSIEPSGSTSGTFARFPSDQIYEMCKRTWWGESTGSSVACAPGASLTLSTLYSRLVAPHVGFIQHRPHSYHSR